jgi:hypothetical protein
LQFLDALAHLAKLLLRVGLAGCRLRRDREQNACRKDN